ncbi:MAG: hypothetical protein BRD41_06390 [Bacteroidetes bacterium QS_1_63_11]|nr:MAG: hypothetical protein BRD41_06390 [Bacteroidetes bacterium QS_1_63_11]
MITLYRRANDPWPDEIQGALDEIIAYETGTTDDSTSPPDDVPALLVLRDEGELVTGEQALRDHLDALRDLLADWDRFQSDACYVEENGSIC